LPPYVDPFRQRGQTLLIVLVVLTALLGIAATILLSVGAGKVAGTSLVLTYALVPMPFLLAAFWWLDRYEPEPRRYKWAAFVWGGVVAVAIALSVQVGVGALWDISDKRMATFIAPLSEEPAKCAFLLLTFARSRRVFDGFVDGLVYAGLVGLGFAFVENVGYYAGSYLGAPDLPIKGAEGATMTFVVRGVFSPLAHPLFTSAFAISLGLALLVRSRILKVLVVTAGLAVSVGLHGLWNGSASYWGGLGFIVTYLVLALVLAGLVAGAIVARVKQGRQLRRALDHVAVRGWLHPNEVTYLCRFADRRRARQHAKAHAGGVAAKAFVRYQRLAVTMAFLYDGVMTGRPKPQAVRRVDALRWAMAQVKPHVLLPPVRPQVPWGPGHPPAAYRPPVFVHGGQPGYAPPYPHGSPQA